MLYRIPEKLIEVLPKPTNEIHGMCHLAENYYFLYLLGHYLSQTPTILHHTEVISASPGKSVIYQTLQKSNPAEKFAITTNHQVPLGVRSFFLISPPTTKPENYDHHILVYTSNENGYGIAYPARKLNTSAPDLDDFIKSLTPAVQQPFWDKVEQAATNLKTTSRRELFEVLINYALASASVHQGLPTRESIVDTLHMVFHKG